MKKLRVSAATLVQEGLRNAEGVDLKKINLG